MQEELKSLKQSAQYDEMIKFIRNIANSSCELVGLCHPCEAVSLLRKYGEDFEPKFNPKQHVWIKCSERLPEKDGRYLVIEELKNLKYIEATSIYDGKWNISRITHWMDLPLPPD
jgi:Protein of unknown function (DUF551)